MKMGTRERMKGSAIAAVIAVFAEAGAVSSCKRSVEPSGSPNSAPQGANASITSSRALSIDACPAPCYLNEPVDWKGNQRQQFFHLSEGSEAFPYGALVAIHSPDDTPF